MLKNFGIKGKLLALCTLLSVVTVTVGGVGYYGLHHVAVDYGYVTEVSLPNMVRLQEMNSNYRRAGAYTSKLGAQLSPQWAIKFSEEVEKSIASYEKSAKAYEAMPFVEGEAEKYKPVQAAWEDWKKTLRTMVEVSKAGQTDRFISLMTVDMERINAQFRDGMNGLMEFSEKHAKTAQDRAEQVAKNSERLAIILSIAGFALAMFLGFIFSNTLSNSLKKIANNLSSGADEVASASQQIASSSEELSSAVTEQAAALQETAASIEEMSAMIAKNNENCASTKYLSNQSHNSASEGRQIVNDMITAIQAIHESNTQMTTEIEGSNREISEIIKVISEIGNKTKVINDIVFQTKLLSFNASVEAARAGEHGKGFAVVAEEVGNLAQMSGNAAREISTMLDESIAKVEGIVKTTQTKVDRLVSTGKEKVETGRDIAQRCGEVLDVIVKNVSTVNGTVNEIAIASNEQDHGVKEVSKAMSQLDQVTQQNSVATRQTAASAETLSAQADSLRRNVVDLLATVQGGGQVVESTASVQRTGVAKKSASPAPTNETAKPDAKKSANVIPMKKEKPVAKSEPRAEQHLQATGTGGASSFPSAEDSRFEDV